MPASASTADPTGDRGETGDSAAVGEPIRPDSSALLDPLGVREVVIDSSRASSSSVALEAYMTGLLLLEQGRTEEAIRELLRALEADSLDGAIHLELARIWAQAGRLSMALQHVEPAVRLLPEDPSPLILQGSLLANAGRPEEAIEPLRRAIEMDPGNVGAVSTLVTIYERLGNRREALALIHPTLHPNLESPAMHQRRGRLLLSLHRTEEAFEDFARVVRYAPDFPEGEADLHRVIDRLDDSALAIPVLAGILKEQPRMDRVRLRLIRLLIDTEAWRDAIAHLETLRTAEPDEPAILQQLGMLYFRDGRFDEAEPLFEDAARLAPGEREPLHWLWRTAMGRKRHGLALDAADRILALDSTDPQGISLRALALVGLGRSSEGVSQIDHYLAEEPENREIAILGAMLLGEDGRHEEAVRRLRELVDAHPEEREARFQLAVALERGGAVDSALAVFDRLIAEDPDDARSLNYAGYMCIDRGLHLDEALDRARRATRLEPENPAYLDSYGWGLFRKGRYRESVEQLQRAVDRAPMEALILKHLGQAQQAAGRPRDAAATFRRALEITPGDRELEDLLRRLEGQSISR